MIFKVVCRKDGDQLARYLLSEKNERVEVMEIRGTVPHEATTAGLKAAMKDMDELGKMTRGQQPLVHFAIAPDDRDRMRKEDWQYAVSKAEAALGMTGQPRAIVSHVYRGKEHLHVVWSRVDIEKAQLIQMPFFKLKALQAAREVELELGLQQTPRRARGAHRLRQEVAEAEKHQQERSADSKAQRDAILQSAWHQSKNGQEFKARIEAAGYRMAVGNRGPLVMDENLEPHSIARSIKGANQKEVKEKLRDLTDLPTVDNVRKPAKSLLTPNRARKLVRDELRFLTANDRPYEQERGRSPEPTA